MKKPRANKYGQYSLLAKGSSEHGGELRRSHKGRGSRPLAVKHSMHLVLRSNQARGEQSFKRKSNQVKISAILKRFAMKFRIQILSQANAGNHLHLHLQLTTRQGYKSFIRAVTGVIAQAVTRASRINKLATKFWDLRPFTRVVVGRRDHRSLTNYIGLNQLEGFGLTRGEAKLLALKHRPSGVD